MLIRYMRAIVLTAGILVVALTAQDRSSLSGSLNDLVQKHPEIVGLYEMSAGERTIRFQVYFAKGALKLLQYGGSRTALALRPTAGRELEFTVSRQLSGGATETDTVLFALDDRGRIGQFRIIFFNEGKKFDALALRKTDLDDANTDPASPEDRLGYLDRHYTKSEHLVSMRDGVRLLTQIYSPMDATERHPILIVRTPYGVAPYGEGFTHRTFPSLWFARERYILVYQDIRGRSMSEGSFTYLAPYIRDKKRPTDVDESSDASDTIDWLLKNVPGHNGKVGVCGSSYPGFLAAMAAIDAHPAVAAVSMQAPMADLFAGDDGHHNGAFYLAHYAGYLYGLWRPAGPPAPFVRRSFPYGTPDDYAYYLDMGSLKRLSERVFGGTNDPWQQAMAHETFDEYWQSRSIYPHLRGIKPAILAVGGWFDAEDLHGTLRTYKTIERHNPGLQNTLVMGPWIHGGWSLLQDLGESRGVFAYQGTKAHFQETIELPFFNHYLKGKGDLQIPEAYVFDTGADRWHAHDVWPPRQAVRQTFLFADRGRLAARGAEIEAAPSFDEFVSDPAKPVPYTMRPSNGSPAYNIDYFVEDQRFASRRPDVLVYASDMLTSDLTIAGPIEVELFVSTTGTDADWVVKVIDVFPGNARNPSRNPENVRMGGYQRLVRGDVLRGKFRNSFERPEPFVSDRVARVAFNLPDIQHTFVKGHRLMIQVQSSWFPLIDRNPQKFCNIRQADDADFQKATHRLHRGREHPSSVTLYVVANPASVESATDTPGRY